MRRFAFALLCSSTLAACTTDALVQGLVAEGWTEHAFQVPGEGVFSYACAPIGGDPDTRAAMAHRTIYAGINATAERAADDIVSGRIGPAEFEAQIEREVSVLTDQVVDATGCVLTGTP